MIKDCIYWHLYEYVKHFDRDIIYITGLQRHVINPTILVTISNALGIMIQCDDTEIRISAKLPEELNNGIKYLYNGKHRGAVRDNICCRAWHISDSHTQIINMHAPDSITYVECLLDKLIMLLRRDVKISSRQIWYRLTLDEDSKLPDIMSIATKSLTNKPWSILT